MKNRLFGLFVILSCGIASADAASFGGPGGKWPKNWPKALEPLRKTAWTWEHGLVGQISYDIPFASREEFESAWPHIVKLKSKGAPLTLINTQHYHGKAGDVPASVVIFPPLKGSKTGPLSTTRIYLKVDGKIVDLNVIPLPADTPIIDKRFSK